MPFEVLQDNSSGSSGFRVLNTPKPEGLGQLPARFMLSAAKTPLFRKLLPNVTKAVIEKQERFLGQQPAASVPGRIAEGLGQVPGALTMLSGFRILGAPAAAWAAAKSLPLVGNLMLKTANPLARQAIRAIPRVAERVAGNIPTFGAAGATEEALRQNVAGEKFQPGRIAAAGTGSAALGIGLGLVAAAPTKTGRVLRGAGFGGTIAALQGGDAVDMAFNAGLMGSFELLSAPKVNLGQRFSAMRNIERSMAEWATDKTVTTGTSPAHRKATYNGHLQLAKRVFSAAAVRQTGIADPQKAMTKIMSDPRMSLAAIEDTVANMQKEIATQRLVFPSRAQRAGAVPAPRLPAPPGPPSGRPEAPLEPVAPPAPPAPRVAPVPQTPPGPPQPQEPGKSEGLEPSSTFPEKAPAGKAYQVVWADGRAVQYFDNLAAAREFAELKTAASGLRPGIPKLITAPKGARIRSSGREKDPIADTLSPKERREIISLLGGPTADTKYGQAGLLSHTDLRRLRDELNLPVIRTAPKPASDTFVETGGIRHPDDLVARLQDEVGQGKTLQQAADDLEDLIDPNGTGMMRGDIDRAMELVELPAKEPEPAIESPPKSIKPYKSAIKPDRQRPSIYFDDPESARGYLNSLATQYSVSLEALRNWAEAAKAKNPQAREALDAFKMMGDEPQKPPTQPELPPPSEVQVGQTYQSGLGREFTVVRIEGKDAFEADGNGVPVKMLKSWERIDNKVEVPADTIQGLVYRVQTGFQHKGSAADVIRYEIEELGNDLGISPEKIKKLESIPAARVMWVTETEGAAKRYGDEVEEIDLDDHAEILAEDGDGGLLILLPEDHPLAQSRPAKKAVPAAPTQRRLEGAIEAPEQSFTRRMAEAQTADEGRGIISDYHEAFGNIEKAAGLVPTVGPGAGGYPGSVGFSTRTTKELAAAVKAVSAKNPELGRQLTELIKDIRASEPHWSSLLLKDQEEWYARAQQIIDEPAAAPEKKLGKKKTPPPPPAADEEYDPRQQLAENVGGPDMITKLGRVGDLTAEQAQQVLDDGPIQSFESEEAIRKTPEGEPKVPDLLKVGDIVTTSYGSGPYVIKQISGPYDFNEYSLGLDKPGAKNPSDKGFNINELVAEGGRILKLLRANDDEVFVHKTVEEAEAKIASIPAEEEPESDEVPPQPPVRKQRKPPAPKPGDQQDLGPLFAKDAPTQKAVQDGILFPDGKDDKAAVPLEESASEARSVRPAGQGKLSPFSGKLGISLRSQFVKTGSLHLPEAELHTPADIAFLFGELTNAAQEHFYAVYMKAGKPFAITHVSMGTLDMSVVHPMAVLAGTIRRKVDGVYVVHNHPSGDPGASPEDMGLTRRLAEALKNVGVTLQGHVIIEGGRYGFISPDGAPEVLDLPDPPAFSGLKVPVFQKRVTKRQGPFPRALETAEVAARYAKNLVGNGRAKLVLIALDARHRMIGNFPLEPVVEMTFAHGKTVALGKAILRRLLLVNSHSFMLAGLGDYVPNLSELRILESMFRTSGVVLLDVFSVKIAGRKKDAESYKAQGFMGPDDEPPEVQERGPGYVAEASPEYKNLRTRNLLSVQEIRKAELQLARQLLEQAKEIQASAKALYAAIRSHGGLKPYQFGAEAEEFKAIPPFLKNLSGGQPLDDMAATLSEEGFSFQDGEELRLAILAAGSVKKVTLREFLPKAKEIIEQEGEDTIRQLVLDKRSVKDIRKVVKAAILRTRAQERGELMKIAKVIEASEGTYLTPTQLARFASAFLGKKWSERITEEQMVELNKTLRKGFIPRRNAMSGEPPVIPSTRALVPVEFQDYPFKELTQTQANAFSGLDPHRAAELVDGKPFGPTTKRVVQPLRNAELEKRKEHNRTLDELRKVSGGMKRGSFDSHKVFLILEDRLPASMEVSDQVRATAAWMRAKLDRLLDEVNEARRAVAKRPVQRRQAYISHITSRTFWSELRGALSDLPDPFLVTLGDMARDYVRNSKTPFFRFAIKRKGGPHEEDAIAAFETYLPSALRVKHMTVPGRLASVFIDSNLPPLARGYFSSQVEKVVHGKLGPIARHVPAVVRRPIIYLKGRFAKGTILGNLGSVAQQPFTLPATIAATSPEHAAMAVHWLSSGTGFAFASEYSKMLQGRIFELDIQDASLRSSFENILALPFEAADKTMVAHAFLAGYLHALSKNKNMSIEQAVEAGDRVAQKTQTGFLEADLAPLFRDEILSSFVQFQNTINGVFNYVKVDLPRQERPFLAALYLVGTTIAMFAIYDALGIRRPDQITDFIPGLSTLRGGPPSARVVSALVVYGTTQNPIEKGKAKRELINALIAFAGAGAVQAKKSLEGALALSEDGFYTADGKLKFGFKGSVESMRALAFGPYGTKAGKEYLRTHELTGRKEMIERIKKTPPGPERQALLRQLRQMIIRSERSKKLKASRRAA